MQKRVVCRCISPMSKELSSRSEKSVMKATDSSSKKGRIRTRGGPDNASCKFKGVRQRTWGKWVSEIRELNCGKRTWIGSFETAEAAAMAYDEAAIKLFGAKAKLNFPERLPQVSCPDHSTAPTSKDTLVDWKEIEIPEEGIIELQQGENPPALAYDKAAGRLAGAPENLPQMSCPVHSTAPTSKDTLVDWKGIEIPEEIIELQQGENPPALAYDKLNFPERLPQVSCPDHSTAPTSKDTLVDWKEIEIPEEGIIELQQGENPPALAYDKAAGRLTGAPENLPQVSCPVHSTAPTSKDTLVDWKGIEIPEIIELQQGENPPALPYDKAAGRLAGAPENLPQVSCPVHATEATSKETLINSRGIKTPEQVECPPGPEFSLTTNPHDCLINDQLINNYDNYIMNEKQYDVAWIVNHGEFQGDNVGKYEVNLEEGPDNIKEKLIVELPEFDDSSLWDEIMATADLEKIENQEDSSAGNFDDFFKDIAGF